MKRVSRQDHVLVVPRIRVVDGIRVDVPAVTSVPVRVYGPDYMQNTSQYTVLRFTEMNSQDCIVFVVLNHLVFCTKYLHF